MFDYTKAVIWPYVPFGAEGEENANQGDNQNNGQNNNSGNNQGSQQNSGTPSNKKDDEDEDDPYKGLSTKELKKLLSDAESKGQSAEDARKALQDKVDEDERKKRSDLENAQKDNETLKSDNDLLQKTNARLAIINEINDDSRFTWHSAKVVAEQLNPEVVKVSKDGKVENLAKELTRIAKEHPYLLKSGSDSGNNNQNQNQNNNNGQSTGIQPGQGSSANNDSAANAARLAEIMPALRSRM